MASRTVKPIDLSAAVEKILNAYGDDMRDNLAAITLSVARSTAKKLTQESRHKTGGSGKYAKGWGVTTENTRLTKRSVVHNKSTPGLPHLLEHGHIMANGKRGGVARGGPHIGAVEQEAVALYQKEVKSQL